MGDNKSRCQEVGTDYLLLILLLSGDVEYNPGLKQASIYPCGFCEIQTFKAGEKKKIIFNEEVASIHWESPEMNITQKPSRLGIPTLGMFIVNFETMSPNWPEKLRPTFLNQQFKILRETLKQR